MSLNSNYKSRLCSLLIITIINCPFLSFAKTELVVYTSQPLNDIKEIVEYFENKNPDIKIKIYRSGTSDLILKLMILSKKKKKSVDVVLLSDTVSMEYLRNKNILAKLNLDTSADQTDCQSEGYYCGTKKIAACIIYNKEIAKPDSWNDLLNPNYKNKIVIADPNYSGAAALQLSTFLHSDSIKLVNFYKNLIKQNIEVVSSNGYVIEYLSNKIKDIGIVVDFMARKAVKKNKHLDYIYPNEGTVVLTEPIAIIAGTNKEKEANKFVNFVLSINVKMLLRKQGYNLISDKVPYQYIHYNPQKLYKEYDSDQEYFSKMVSQKRNDN